MNDSKPRSQATRQAIDEYVHLVRLVVARFVRRLPPSIQRDDLMAAGMIGLVRALEASGNDRATNPEMFAAYARIRIRGAILDELRRHDWSPRRRRAPERASTASSAPTVPPPVHVVGFDDLAPEALGNVLAGVTQDPSAAAWGTRSPEEELTARNFDAEVRRSVDALPARERVIVEMRYFDEVPSKEVAAILGVSEARVSQLHARAMASLRSVLASDDMVLAA